MEDLSSNRPAGSEDSDGLIPLDDNLDDPISPGNSSSSKGLVSHSPLTLGGAGPVKAMKPPEAAKPVAPKKVQANAPTSASTGRINGVKTFFTKLHPGALDFLDEQINKWLKENPNIQIKRTNTTTGELTAKKTEINIIITVWYQY